MALLPGYRSAPGSARRIVTPSGDVISHRQYRNVVVRSHGWRSLHEFETSQGWARTRERVLENDPRADVSYSSRLAGDYAAIKHKRERGDHGEGRPGSLVQNTPLGRLLIALGVRDEGERWGDYR